MPELDDLTKGIKELTERVDELEAKVKESLSGVIPAESEADKTEGEDADQDKGEAKKGSKSEGQPKPASAEEDLSLAEIKKQFPELAAIIERKLKEAEHKPDAGSAAEDDKQ